MLIDTHLLLWATVIPCRLPDQARAMIVDADNEVLFSVVSIWEVAIKQALRRPDFDVDPGTLRQALIEDRFSELAITGLHAVAIQTLPAIHGDPFDRMLVAQAIAENVLLVTSNDQIARYSGPIRRV